MTGINGEDLFERRQRLLRAREADQRIAAMMPCVKVVGLERERLVEAFERIRIALERVLHQPEIDPGVRRARIDLERRMNEPIGLAGLTELRLDGAEEIERVEVIGRDLDDARVGLFRLAQLSLPVQGQRLLEHLRDSCWRTV